MKDAEAPKRGTGYFGKPGVFPFARLWLNASGLLHQSADAVCANGYIWPFALLVK